MKLLSLELDNINSLAGKQVIDFTAPEFGAGLFAIVGETGAGKSSILDAICLALYGKTPRQKIDGSNNEVMTKNTMHCSATLRFEMSGQVFRAEFHQQRSKSRSGGEGALKKANRELICENTKEHGLSTEKVTGMKFEQFTRCVLLPQFEFQNFLQAKTTDKSELLEAITGTADYSAIGMRIFAFYQEARDHCAKLEEAVKELPNAENAEQLRTQLAAEEKQIKEALAQLKAQRDSTQKALTYWANAAELKKFAAELQELTAQIPPAQEALEGANKSLGLAEATLKTAQMEENELQSFLKEQVIPLEGKITHAQNDAKASEKTLKNAQEQHDKVAVTLTKYSAILAQLEKDEPQTQEKEAKRVAEAQALLQERKESKEKAKDNTATLQASHQEAGGEEAKECLSHELFCAKTRLTLLKELPAQASELDKARKKAQSEAAASQQCLKDMEARRLEISKAEVSMKAAQKALEDMKLLSGVGEQLRARLEELKEGDECPLCGSTSHPKKGIIPDESELKAASKLVKNSEEKYRLLCISLAELDGSEKQRQDNIVALQESMSNQAKALQKKLDELELANTEAETLQAAIEACKATQKHTQTKLDALNMLAKWLEKAKAEQQTAERACAKSEAALIQIKHDTAQAKSGRAHAMAMCKKSCESSQSSLKEKEAALTELQGKNKELQAELSKYQAELKSILQGKTREEMEAASQTKLTAATTAHKACADAIKQLELKLNSLSSTQASKAKDQQEREAKLAKLKAPTLPAEELTQLASQLEEQDKILTQQKGGLKERKKNFDNQLAEGDKKRKELSQAQRRLADWDYLNKNVGGSDGAKFRNYVQSIIFEELIVQSGEVLSKLTDRYTLLPDPDSALSMLVQDNYIVPSPPRKVSNLSGGESFRLSLALALGLKNMLADSRFEQKCFLLDEGFGSLDEKAQAEALDMLRNIQGQDALVGIISHTASVREMNPKITVTRQSNGHSRISGAGVA